MTMRILKVCRWLVVVVTATLLATVPQVVDAQTTSCQGTCEIDLQAGDCETVLNTKEFSGECCALREVDGSCYVLTTSTCRMDPQDGNLWDCYTDNEGNQQCDPNFMQYISQSNLPCPRSDYPISGFTNSPTIDPGATPSPSETPSPSQAGTLVSTASPTNSPTDEETFAGTAYIDIIDGDPLVGDCYFIERFTQYNPQWGTDRCINTTATYTYYIGGDSASGETNYPYELYLTVRAYALHDCDTNADSCEIQVLDPSQPPGSVEVCNQCSYDDQEITMVDCSNLGGIFPAGSQTVDIGNLFDGGQAYDEQFFTLAYDEDKCLHPYYVGTFVPSYQATSNAPSYSGTSGPTYPTTPAPTSVTASSISTMIVDGDLSQGECYSVEREWLYQTYSSQCTGATVTLTYYNGGTNGDYLDTGYPQETYLTVRVNALFNCPDQINDFDTCTISTGGQECDTCTVNGGVVIMEDCTNLGGVFSPEQGQTLNINSGSPFSGVYFRLAYDQEKCNHPAILSTTTVPTASAPSMVPTLVPVSDAPSGDGSSRYMISSFVKEDIVQGDVTQGDCYLVERYLLDTIYSDGCTDTFLRYSYYNGGMNADDVDSGFSKDEYLEISVEVSHSCFDQTTNPQTCTMKIHMDGNIQTCQTSCSYVDYEVTMGDCTNVVDEVGNPVFPTSGSQTVVLFFDGATMTYEEEFFTLAYDEDKCLHPSYVGTYAPSYTPSPIPYTGSPTATSEPSSQVVASSTYIMIVDGDPSLGDCYTVERDWVYQTFTDSCNFVDITLTYYNGGTNGDGIDTQYEQLTYLVVEVESLTCPAEVAADPDHCTIKVHTPNDGIQICNTCTVDSSTYDIIMEDCSNVGDIFAPQRGQTISTVNEPPLDEVFFGLTFDQEKCNHPALGSGTTVPSMVPTLVPVSDAPSGEGIASSFAVQDIVQGDISRGDCYLVERYMTDTIYNNGCTDTFLRYTYYNGGMNSDYVDTGYAKEEYLEISVETFHSCDDESANPQTCTTKLHVDGNILTCDECSFDNEKVTLGDCFAGVQEGILSAGSQTVALFFDGVSMPYEEQFFRLAYNEDYCLHPAVIGNSGPGPTTYPSYSPVPTDSGPTFIPSDEPPTQVPWPFEPTMTPIPSSLRCYNEWANGIVADDKCHATDIDHCIEEWEDGCTYISAFYTYYNQFTSGGASSQELYYYVTITSASGCDPESNPLQPENGCVITSFGETCQQCFSDGDMVSLVDCSNLSFDSFDPAQGQTISLTTPGDAFDVVETEDMCDHPAVELRSDATVATRDGSDLGSDNGKSKDKGKSNTLTLPISVTLHYFFFKDKGQQPGRREISMLVAATMDFFHTVLLDSPEFTDFLLDIEMKDILDDYSPATPDEFTLTLEADVVLDSAAAESASTRDAATLMAQSNLSKYVHEFVRKNRSGQRNIFFEVQKVRFKGVGLGKLEPTT